MTPFFAWYEQAGTPKVTLTSHYHEAERTLRIELSQQTLPTPGQPTKSPLPIPVTVGHTNGSLTEVQGKGVHAGLKVITGQLASASK